MLEQLLKNVIGETVYIDMARLLDTNALSKGFS